MNDDVEQLGTKDGERRRGKKVEDEERNEERQWLVLGQLELKSLRRRLNEQKKRKKNVCKDN